MRAIILAGGMGTRLRTLVPDLPKPMAPIAGRPFLEYLIEKLAAGGVRDIVLSVGYRADAISDHFGARWGEAAISYVREDEPLGTGGAIALAARGWAGGSLLVLNGDTFVNLDFADLVRWRNGAALGAPLGMVLCQVADVSRYGAVHCEAGVVSGFAEKGPGGPGLINAGAYLIDPSIFPRFGLSGQFSLETDLIQVHLAALRPRAYVTEAFFIDIGVAEDFVRAQTAIPAHAHPTGP
jgi:D-glycero-alpha-D-manno-heptose 1-phosphate guanylyltransferase